MLHGIRLNCDFGLNSGVIMNAPLANTSVIDLGGRWQFRADPRDLGEHYPQQLAYTHADDARWMNPDQPDRDWQQITVPGSWTAQGHREVHRAWYRTRFAAPTRGGTVHAGRVILTFDGVDYLSDVWLNGHYLGSHEGYLGRFSYEVSGLLREQNTLVVKVVQAHDVDGREDQMRQYKSHFVGSLGRFDMNDPESKPAGIWGAVTLTLQGVVGVDDAALDYSVPPVTSAHDPLDTVPVSAVLTCTLSTQSGSATTLPEPRHVDLHWSITDETGTAVAEGRERQLRVTGRRVVTVDLQLDARLWYTWDLGPQQLYTVTVDVVEAGVVDATAGDATAGDATAERMLDRRQWSTGFRRLDQGAGWNLRLNGLPFYQRGANYLSELDLSSMSAERYHHDAELFRAANLNTVHPFCLVEGDALYSACNELGLLVYQDFPLWLMADTSSEMVRRAVVQFDEMITRLHRHPSIAIWNFGSQASINNMDKLCTALVARARTLDPSRIAHLGNAAVAYEAHDDTHPTGSFFWTEDDAGRFEAEYDWRRDSHMYPGWYFDDIRAIRSLPHHHFELITEFGAQALPDRDVLATFIDVDGAIDWTGIARHCGQPALLQRHNPTATTLSELIESSQRYQAVLLRHHVEFIRGLKGAPGHGLHVFAFVDSWPSVTWSILDHNRTPKQGYHAVTDAMRPVLAMLDDPLRDSRASDGGRGVHSRRVLLVNDSTASIDATLLVDADGARVFEAPVVVGTTAAEAVDVPLPAGYTALTLRLEWAGGQVTNAYEFPAPTLMQSQSPSPSS
jgi:beta-mannosidase